MKNGDIVKVAKYLFKVDYVLRYCCSGLKDLFTRWNNVFDLNNENLKYITDDNSKKYWNWFHIFLNMAKMLMLMIPFY